MKDARSPIGHALRRVLQWLLDRFGEWLQWFHTVPLSERLEDFTAQHRYRHEGIGLTRKRR